MAADSRRWPQIVASERQIDRRLVLSVPWGLLAAAAVVFVIQAAAWPLSSGRAGAIDLLYYLDVWNGEPLLPALIGQPPVAALIFGSLLTHLGPYAVELLLGVCFIAAISAIYVTGAVWSHRMGLVLGILLLLHASYGALFHKIDSDALFATGFAVWLCYAVRYAAVHSLRAYEMHGAAVALLTLTRPAGQMFLLFALYPLLFAGGSIARRIGYAGAFVVVAATVVGSWSLVNQMRFGQSSARFRNAAPLYG